jgi:hypothetical protein
MDVPPKLRALSPTGGRLWITADVRYTFDEIASGEHGWRTSLPSGEDKRSDPVRDHTTGVAILGVLAPSMRRRLDRSARIALAAKACLTARISSAAAISPR